MLELDDESINIKNYVIKVICRTGKWTTLQ